MVELSRVCSKMKGDEEDERREASISSAASLQPNFKPEKTTSITQAHLSKFQELHRRRLQIKSKPKIKTKSKGRADGIRKPFRGNKVNDEGSVVEKSSKIKEDSSSPLAECSAGNDSSSQEYGVAVQMMVTKRQKLHWGLDTKERWERKSNM